MQGLDLAELQHASDQLAQAMQDDPTFVGVNSDQDKVAPTVQVAIDRERAAALGVTPDDIQTTLGLAFGGQQVSQIYAATDQYQVVLELLPQYQLDATGLSRLYLPGTGGGDGAADGGDQDQPAHHAADHQPCRPDSGHHHVLRPGARQGAERRGDGRAARPPTGSADCPTSVQGSFAGTAAAFQSSTSNMGLLLLMAMIVVYIILGILYESFIHPLTILSGLPSAALGALLTLCIFRHAADALCLCRHDHADRHRQEERHHDDRLRLAAAARRRRGACGGGHL